jgi:HAD superfamily hydrolase (TIGR01509 family)
VVDLAGNASEGGFAILWDMDGTLVDSEPLHESVLLATLDDEGITPPGDLHTQLLGLSAPAIHRLFQQRFGLQLSLTQWLERRWSVYLSQAHTLRPRCGAMEAFLAAENRAWLQAVVSNSPSIVVQANLNAIGLAGRVHTVVSADDVRNPKPYPEPYLLAMNRMALPNSRCFAVEDSATGARAALSAGCRTLFWPQSEQSAPVGAIAVPPGSSAIWAMLVRHVGS